MDKVVERKKEEKKELPSNYPTLRNPNSAASNYPTVTAPVPASGPAPLRRSRHLNPNPVAEESGADKIDTEESGANKIDTDESGAEVIDADESGAEEINADESGAEEIDTDESGAEEIDADESGAEEIDADESGAAVNKRRMMGNMTDDQRVRYREQVYKSDGFDVDSMPGVKGYGLIRPLILSNMAVYSRCEQVSQRAIDKYNRRRKQRRTSFKSETTPQLKLVRVLKAMVEDCDLIRYYVTFEAEIQGRTKIYRTLARWSRFPISADNFSVLFIREYKKEKEKGDQVIGVHSASELETQLNAASMASLLAILFFSQTHPCRFVSPLYTSLAGNYPKVVFLKVDIDEASEVAALWNIRSAPCILFLKNGKEVVDEVDGIDEKEFRGKIAQHSRKQS